ncbi:MAG: Lrp/AsnC family transcriptional regulator [Rhodothermales bacterium]|nr:Lrp/AsnC family transcriptional regulator [Rhodothermales bacterium]
MERIDDIDARILELLQAHGRMKRSRIAEDVGLSVPTVSDRMRKLEERGVLIGFSANLSPKRLHFDITAFVRVRIDGSENYAGFVDAVTKMAEVQELHSVTGDGSHIMKIRTKNTTTLEALLSRLQALPGVHGTTTSIVLSSQKETTTLPVEAMTL